MQQFAEFLNFIFSSLGTTFTERAPETIRTFQSTVQWAAIGSILYGILFAFGVDTSISFILCVGVTFLVRMVSVRYNIVSV